MKAAASRQHTELLRGTRSRAQPAACRTTEPHCQLMLLTLVGVHPALWGHMGQGHSSREG